MTNEVRRRKCIGVLNAARRSRSPQRNPQQSLWMLKVELQRELAAHWLIEVLPVRIRTQPLRLPDAALCLAKGPVALGGLHFALGRAGRIRCSFHRTGCLGFAVPTQNLPAGPITLQQVQGPVALRRACRWDRRRGLPRGAEARGRHRCQAFPIVHPVPSRLLPSCLVTQSQALNVKSAHPATASALQGGSARSPAH